MSTEELLVRYRQTTQATERSHYQIIWLLATGKTVNEVAQVTGYTRIWIYQLIKRYNQIIYLPAYSPELQPAERLWPLANEIVANHSPSSLDELEALLVLGCQELMKQHNLISGLTCYHWWPRTREA
ncbi:helix-turn-helix domain-containing protein [Anabaena azotica FACHB-119]|uniref:Helix-turn-helix domain-containing protein n=2 Tax=Anabaena azotica TaxID=197653 RepID=A0ABR8CX10_9NOST|nr:helix-turn-helix domain-containing protein [Anabaena azotica FACHB-119]